MSTMYTQDGHKFFKKNRSCWGLLFKFEGKSVFKNHKNSYVADQHHIILLPKGATYEWACTQTGRYILIDFEADLEVNELFCLSINENEPFKKNLNTLNRLQLSQKPFSNIESIYLVYALILNGLKAQHDSANYAPSSKKHRLQPAIDYIINNFTTQIKNEQLAALCGISVVYFRKLFFEAYGISPMNYIQSLRIRQAQEILRSDYSSITDIAFTLGYNNIYEFSKAFKKHTGISPSRY